MTPLDDSWQRAWRALGLVPPAGLRERLVAAWREPQRHYHSLQHLQEGVDLLSEVRGEATHAGEVELALWFHDAVYDPQARDNERRSADDAAACLALAGAAPEVARRVHALVMATCHAAEPATPDERLLVDIDLAILGAAPARFAEYDAQVRAEYAWVPEAVYRDKRREVLAGFLARASLYGTPRLRDRLEAAARANLRAAIDALAPPATPEDPAR